jgi:hypothetical protein
MDKNTDLKNFHAQKDDEKSQIVAWSMYAIAIIMTLVLMDSALDAALIEIDKTSIAYSCHGNNH